MTLRTRTGLRALAVLGVLLAASGVARAQALAQTQGANFGTASIGRVEMWVGATGGNGTYVWSIVDGSLPPGVALRTDIPSYFPAGASAGLIGIATTPGTYIFTLRATSGGVDANQPCTLKISALMGKENQLPDAFVGVAYSYSLSALGNVGSALWSPPSGLPAGMTLSAGGLLSGTPTSAGNYNPGFALSDGTDTVNLGLSVNVYAIAITTAARLPNAVQDVFYTTPIAASGGAGGYGFDATGLPNGLSIDFFTGDISGTVSSGGSGVGKFSISVTATDSDSVSYTKTMLIDVVGATPALPSIVPSNSNIYDCTLGVPCTRTISVLNGGTAPFSWTASGLPAGMSIRSGSAMTTSFVTPGDAQLWGTPTALGSFNVQLTVTDALSVSVAHTFPMKVSPLLQTTFLTSGTIDTAYSQTLRVLGGTGPYAVVQTAGQLPVGLTVDSGTLVLSGTPAESGGNFSPAFTYTDSASHTLQIDSFLIINGHGSGVSIFTTTLASATIGLPYSNQFSSCCADSIAWSQLGGTRPPGLLFTEGGLLTGTPSTLGTYTFLLKAADYFDAANYAARQFTLSVLVAPPSITPSATTVAPGAVVTATAAEGPANTGDWVALYATGAPAAAFLQWQYLSGTHTAPSVGLSGATLTLTLPLTAGIYELRFFLNNTYTVLATSAPISIVAPPATVTPSATSGTPGAPMTATVANGPGNKGDWVALYATGAPATALLQWQYLNGTQTAPTVGLTAATLTFTLPLMSGTYELRFFLNNTYTVLATSASITIVGASVTPSATSAAPGATVTATIANGPGFTGDWVALYSAGAPVANYVQWQYLNGTHTAPTVGLSAAALTFTLPLTPGTYELRVFRNNTYTLLAMSAHITIAAAGPASVTPSATTAALGAAVTATIANGPGNTGDWVALYATGAPAAAFLQWQYLNGTHTAPTVALSEVTLTFTLSLSGTYELRFFQNNTYTVLATSAHISVAAAGPVGITPSATTVAPGATVTATIVNGPGNAGDWVALYATGASAGNYVQWQYLNATHTAPAVGLGGAVLTFTLPVTLGTYQLRFFQNNTYTVLATSATITVQ
jgi:putative Ig domain-containing protein